MKRSVLFPLLLTVCLLCSACFHSDPPPVLLPPATTAPVSAAHLPLSDEDGYCFSQLGETDRQLYGQMLNCFRRREADFESPLFDADRVVRICDAVLNDHPELFWYTGAKTVTTQTLGKQITGLTLSLEYAIPPERIPAEEAQVRAAAQLCLSSVSPDWEDHEKIKAVYDWLILRTEYDPEASGQNLHSVMTLCRGVCSGYAHAAQYLLHQLGIPCAYVTGTADGGSHAWNLVQADGDWYHLDVTRGDPLYSGGSDLPDDYISYEDFCVPSEWLEHTHRPDGSFPLPDCTATACNYHVRNHLWLEQYDEEEVLNILIRAARMQENASIRFADNEERELAYHLLYEEQAIFPLLSEVSQLTGSIDPASVSFCREGPDGLCIFMKYI